MPRSIRQLHGQRSGLAGHVQVRRDQPVGVDDEARAQALLPALTALEHHHHDRRPHALGEFLDRCQRRRRLRLGLGVSRAGEQQQAGDEESAERGHAE